MNRAQITFIVLILTFAAINAGLVQLMLEVMR